MRFIPRKNRKPPTVIIVALIDVLMVVSFSWWFDDLHEPGRREARAA
ncbi:MAG: hypothetical protein CM1200mP34_1020 [Verrucomicrobiales bacterium]|nr:MAG: hypothetical protein CM1200mP34_1020 [Verrucomicrobiales bacterium]